MSTCKDCLHNEVCVLRRNRLHCIGDVCKHFKPTADVVEVVRCGDCIFANVEDGKIKCHNTYGLLVTEETEYCSRGRRREG